MTDLKDSNEITPSVQQNNPLTRKLNKILETRLENDRDLLEATKSLSTFFIENSLRNRRNLRSDIERRSLIINEDFVKAFGDVKEQIDSVYVDVKAMHDCCRDMTERLKAAKGKTRDLISQTTKLQNESTNINMKHEVAAAFLEKFQLKPEEVKILRGTRDGHLHPDFFAVLTKVKKIHDDCKILLRSNQETTGLEIMDSMALHQESAYEKLYRWTQGECRLLTNDNIELTGQICKAMKALEDRPVLFRYSLDEYGTARRSAIVRSFIDALTKGGSSGTPRPIELHSHDPLRYVGDMMAWIHQACATEKEYLKTILKDCVNEEKDSLALDVMGHITEGLGRPLKVRLEQVLLSDPQPIVLYKLTNLLQFYYDTLNGILQENAALVQSVTEMHNLNMQMFYNSLSSVTSRLLEKVEMPPADLSATSSVTSTLQLLQDILSSHDSSLVSVDVRKEDYGKIVKAVIEPLVKMCSVSASNLKSTDMATYMLNNLHLMHTTLALFEFTDNKLELLKALMEAHVDTLISEQAAVVLTRTNLVEFYQKVQQHNVSLHGPLSQLPEADAATLKNAMAKFDSYLASPDSLVLPQCNALMSTKLRDAVKQRSTELICRAYSLMYESLKLQENEYPEANTIAPRTPDQVMRLLT